MSKRKEGDQASDKSDNLADGHHRVGGKTLFVLFLTLLVAACRVGFCEENKDSALELVSFDGHRNTHIRIHHGLRLSRFLAIVVRGETRVAVQSHRVRDDSRARNRRTSTTISS